MHILLTGAAGRVGQRTLNHLLSEGHRVTATDVVSLPESFTPSGDNYEWVPADLTSLSDIDALFENPLDAVIHLGAIPNPRPSLDDRTLHANNVVGSYNVLRTAVDRGIKWIVQASSVNAHGLSYSPPGHTTFDRFPIDEEVERRPEDAYALSKHICEIQADSLVRLVPGVRIASLRFHMVCDDYDSAYPHCRPTDLFSWTSYDACARAALLGVTSDGWSGHEVFNIAAPEICWEGSVEQKNVGPLTEGGKVGTLELVSRYCKYKPEIDTAYFEKNKRAAIWTSEKAERMLGWKHDL